MTVPVTTAQSALATPPPKPKRRRRTRRRINPRNPLLLFYVALVALLVSLAENEVQTLITAGPGALFDGDFDFEQVRHTWIGQLAATYPAIFWPFAGVCVLLAGIGWLLNRRLKAERGSSPFTQARRLDRTTFPMGDPEAATFHYFEQPVQDAYDAAVAALRTAAQEHPAKRGIVVLGKANAGKTRLALEALIPTLPQWWVLRWSEAGQQLADLSDEMEFAGRQVVLFVDDAQKYAGGAAGPGGAPLAGPAATLRTLWARAKEHADRVVLVATCREEELDAVRDSMSWLFTELTAVQVPLFDPKAPEWQAIRDEFAAAGAQHTGEGDGTLGSLVLGLEKKREQYARLKNARNPAVTVLHAMRLLAAAGINQQTERRLRGVSAGVFGGSALETDEAVWRRAVADLVRDTFVSVAPARRGEQRLEIRKDAYLEVVVDDYPDPAQPQQLERDRAALSPVFLELADAEAFFYLGVALGKLDRFAEALAAFEQALTLDPQLASAWYNKGITLAHLGRDDEALVAFERALALNPQDVAAWTGKGGALVGLGQFDEALAAAEQALALNPRKANAWCMKGIVLEQLGRAAEAEDARAQARALGFPCP